MKTIAVLIDFTEGAKVALKQALLLAEKTKANIVAVHIASGIDKAASAESDLKLFLEENTTLSENIRIEIGIGNLFDAVQTVFNKIEPDLCIVCTHGVKGMFQHLFGAHILKLAQSISFPTIVLQENNKVNLSEIKSILFPIGPHPEFEIKIRECSNLAKELSAEIIIYEIDRPGIDVENQLGKNKQNARDYFTKNEIVHHKVLDDLKVISAGYSRQTLAYAEENNLQLISIMASISKNDVLFGVGDKENFLINSLGIPILCCN